MSKVTFELPNAPIMVECRFSRYDFESGEIIWTKEAPIAVIPNDCDIVLVPDLGDE